RWYIITPEEWVRQNFLLFLIHTLNYPASLIAVEKQIAIGELKKRFDIVVYKNSAPFLIIECKEINVQLSENTITQVLHYNKTIQAMYIIITNGVTCVAYKKNGISFQEILQLPQF
ncbi:MAG: type I restriction enzyme HsdR N-terminal domain-containing protein, partial [Ferruginibacter sp.]